jgi:microcompartment protein CcmL/EutN
VTTGQGGLYTVIVNGTVGSVTNSATLTVNVPVSVSVPPASQTTVVGSNVTVSVTASGTGLSYEWLFNGSVVGTSSSLTLSSVTTNQAGLYTVIVNGTVNSVTNSATLTVNVPVSVSVPPANQTTVVGSNVTFSVTASGTGLSYEWLFNGSVVGTGSSLTLNNVTTNQAGLYTVIVNGTVGSVTNSATLTVNVPVSVSVPPANQTTVVGSNVTFSVTASGTGLSYQWLFSGSVVGTGSSLTLNSVTTNQAGLYTVIVNGTVGSVTNSATLTVNVPVSVSVPPASQTTVVGSNVTFSVTASGTGLSYQWLFNGSVVGTGSSLTLNSVTTNQAGLYTVIVNGTVNSVTNSATLTVNVPVSVSLPPANQTTVVGSNVTFSVTASGTGLSYEWLFNGSVVGTTSSLTLNSVTTNQAGLYTVIVNGTVNSVTNSATLTVNVPVSVSVPPANQTTVVGSNVTFSVTANGTGLSYQWLFNGSVVGTGSSLTLNNVTTGQGGLYTVIVNGTVGSVTNSATLTVNVPVSVSVPPANQTTVVGSNVTFSVTASGTGLSYEWLFNGSVVGSGSSLTLNNVTTNQAGLYTVIVNGTVNSVTNSATLTVNVPVSVSVPPANQTTVVGSNVTFSVTASGTGLSYEWLFNGSVAGIGSSLTLNNVTTNQAGLYTVIVNGTVGSATNSATLIVNVPVSVDTPPGDQTVCPGDTATFSVTATGTDLGYQWLQGTNTLTGQTNDSLTLSNVTTDQGGLYTVIVSGSCGSVTNSATLTVNVPVSVSVPPADQTTVVGSNVTFSMTASGTGLSYQWLFNGSVVGTDSSLTLNNATTDQAGLYTAIVNGACGSVTNSATLTVNVPVSVSVPPANQTTVVGSNATFSVTASGTGLSYQWLFNGSVVGSGSSLTLNNVTTGQGGLYTVIVNGTVGSVTNSTTLTVNVPVSVSVPPANQTAVVGSNATFSVTASGTGLSYEWLFNGSVVGTGSSLTLNNVTTGQGGLYTVIVNGTVGSVTNSATLTVNVPVSVDTPPGDQTTVVGSNVTFSVTASGTGLSYEWLFNGSVVGTGSSLTLNNVTTNQAGLYTVIVNGTVGSATNSATLIVNVPVSVDTPPGDQTVCPGDTATFSVTATGTDLGYQWLQGTNALTGQTNDSLTLNNVTADAAGTYSVVVSGAAGQPVTNSAMLTVNTAVTATPLSNLALAAGNSATFSTTASGTGPFNYVWKKNGNLIGGQTGNSLTLASVSAVDTATYSVEVSGACGSVTNSATLTVNTAPVLPAQANLVINNLTCLVVTNTASDPDIPAQVLTYTLVNPPAGATIDTNGVITWPAPQVQESGGDPVLVATNVITTVVTDNGVPPLSATNSFTVTIIPEQPQIVVSIARQDDGSQRVTFTGTPFTTYLVQATTNILNSQWITISTNTAGPDGTWNIVDTDKYPLRFYRSSTAP